MTVKRSIVTSLLLLFVALGLPGTQVLAVVTAAAEAAAEEDVSAEEREERMLRRSASRKPPARGKTTRQSFILSQVIGSASHLTGNVLRSRSFLQSNFSTDNFHLLPIYRI